MQQNFSFVKITKTRPVKPQQAGQQKRKEKQKPWVRTDKRAMQD